MRAEVFQSRESWIFPLPLAIADLAIEIGPADGAQSLAIGGAEQSVQVASEAVLLDTESANNSVTLDSHLIESLPNSYRNPLNFVFALAGTTEAQSGMTSRSTSFDQNASVTGAITW